MVRLVCLTLLLTIGAYSKQSFIFGLLDASLVGASSFLGLLIIMKTLDLHGMYHDAVQRQVENFVLLNESPVRIITGHSSRMKELVMAIVERHDFDYHYERYINYGSLIITEKMQKPAN